MYGQWGMFKNHQFGLNFPTWQESFAPSLQLNDVRLQTHKFHNVAVWKFASCLA